MTVKSRPLERGIFQVGIAPVNRNLLSDSCVQALYLRAYRDSGFGETDLFLNVTPGDHTEGFPLDPTGFANVTFETGHALVPDPSALSIILAVETGNHRP